MTGILLRLLIYAIIIAAIYFGLRRIINDWRKGFRDLDQKTRERDIKESKRPGVIDLKRGDDGVYRPGGKEGGAKKPDDEQKK